MNGKILRIIITIFITIFLSACSEFTDMFSTLEIISYSPADQRYGIPADAHVYIEFNNNVNIGDITTGFNINSDSGNIAGTFNWASGKSFYYIPTNNMKISEKYTINIPRTIRDLNGNSMQADFISNFYVGEDMTRPSVIESQPPYTEGGTTDIPCDIEYLRITFSEPMNHSKTETAFTLTPSTPGYFSWHSNSTELRYILTAEMDYAMQYKMSVSATAEDIAGNPLINTCSVIFITGNDFESPEITGIYNAADTPPVSFWNTSITNEEISKSVEIAVQFTKHMKRIETESSFSMTPSVSGNFSWNTDSTIMIFSPQENLSLETLYVIKINTTAEDTNGWKPAQEYQTIIFTNNADSLYIRIGDVSGSHDSINYTSLFSEIPGWPVGIEMGPAIAPPDGSANNYYFQIQFINDNNLVEMSPYSIYDNILYEGFGAENDPELSDINWDASHTTLFLTFNNLSNDESNDPVLYRLTIAGGENGIQDINDNTMPEDFRFEFKE